LPLDAVVAVAACCIVHICCQKVINDCVIYAMYTSLVDERFVFVFSRNRPAASLILLLCIKTGARRD